MWLVSPPCTHSISCLANQSHSELHTYRGLDPSGSGFIMGHEFTGHIVEAGSAVKSVQVGDKVVVPFTTSW